MQKNNALTARRSNGSRQTGFSIVEVMVASVIVAIGIMGITALQLVTARSASNIDMNNKVSYIVEHVFESMRVNPEGAAAGDYSVTVDAATYDCSSAQSAAASSCITGTCTTSEMATFHIDQAICGNASGAQLSQGLKQSLPQSSLTIACDGVCDADDGYVKMSVKVAWSDRELKEGISTANDIEVHSYINRK